jgi:putative transposase
VNDAVSLDGVDYQVIGNSADGYVLLNSKTGLHEAFDHAALAALSLAGRLEFKANQHSAITTRTRLLSGSGSLAALPLKHQTIVAWRVEWITAFYKLEAARNAANERTLRRDRVEPPIRSTRGMKAALAEIGPTIQALAEARARPLDEDGTFKAQRKLRCGTAQVGLIGPSVRQFRIWLKAYEEAAQNPLVLRPRTARCGNRSPRYAAEVERLLQEHAALFASEERHSREKCHKLLCTALADLNAQRTAEGLEPYAVPSDRTLCRRIAALDMFLVESHRIGEDAATRKHRFLVGQAEALRVGQRVELDEWKIDLYFLLSQTDLLANLTEEQIKELKKRRWFLCVAIDVASRCILAMRLDHTASVRNAIATLQMVVSDKSILATAVGANSPWHHMALRPETIATDSGASFVAEVFHLVVLALGSSHDIPPAGMPHLRGTVERLFRTLSCQLVRHFSGQSFSNVVERGDYPALERVSITVEEFVLLAVRHVLDVYHNLPHAGLGGETPANAWKRLTALYGVIPVPGRNERRAIFGLRMDRTLGRHGIRFMGLDYRADVLRDHYLRCGSVPLPVRVDPQDIGAISVEVNGTWHEVRAATSGFDGVRLTDHQALCDQLAKRFANQAKLSEPIVFEALKAIRGKASAAKDAAEFLTRFAEPDDIARAERRLRNFVIPTDEEFANRAVADALNGVIPTGGVNPTKPREGSATDTEGSEPISRRRPDIGLED